MKTIISFRVLCLLGFLLLMAPFYDSCNDKRMKKTETDTEVVCDSSIVVQSEIVQTNTISEAQSSLVVIEEKSRLEKGYRFVDDERTLNAFEFAKWAFDFSIDVLKTDFQTNLKDFNKTSLKDKFSVVIIFLFLFIVIISFIIFCISFSQKIKWISKLSLLNFIFTIITLFYIIFFEASFKEISQIKWGYYTFIVVQVFIYYLSKKIEKQNGHLNKY